jgi:hypothetical protein
MAKKSAAALAVTGTKIEQAKAMYLDAKDALDEAWKENDRLFSNRTSDNLKKGVTMEQFNANLADISRLGQAAMRSYDAWQYVVKHEHDIENVPEEDVRGVLSASFSDKVGELKFSVNYGILASKVAQAIKRDTQEASIDYPLCRDDS